MMAITKIFLFSLVILFGSCCTKQECITSSEIATISMVGFPDSETDTVVIETFPISSNLSADRIDSIVVEPLEYISTVGNIYLPLPSRLDQNVAYRITTSGARQIYDLTDIEFKTATCNKCVGASDKYQLLRAYSVNGRRQESNELTINRD